MHPMDFEEFLWASGEKAMANAIREHAQSCEPYVLHEHALDLYHRFLVVGGMPMPLREWLETGSLDMAMEELAEIDATYTADMTDPENGISGISAKRIWDSLPKQLLRSSTKKFKYADVVRGGRRARLLEPLEWLEAAGVVTRNELTKDTHVPLSPYNDEEGSYFKVYVADTGIMFKKFGIAPSLFLDATIASQLSSDFRGALAENFVMQSLQANDIKTFYWMPEEGSSRGEVDFVFQNDHAEVVPVEVKSARNVRAKSLQRLMAEGGSPYAIRLSEQNFSRSTNETGTELRSLPLYAAFTIGC
jgi:predicted AAA+ superfamily ATPase